MLTGGIEQLVRAPHDELVAIIEIVAERNR